MNGTVITKIWKTSMHQQHSKCAKQMAHNMDINSCLTNSSISSHCLFNILFQRQIRIYQRYELIHKYTVSLCNSSNSLRGHEQQQKLSEQLWAEQLCTYTNLYPFYLSLCPGSNSPRLYKQCNGTVQTALSQTAPNSVKLLSSKQQGESWRAAHEHVTSYWCSIQYNTH